MNAPENLKFQTVGALAGGRSLACGWSVRERCVARFTEASAPLPDFIKESNRGDHVWFVADIAELPERLTR